MVHNHLYGFICYQFTFFLLFNSSNKVTFFQYITSYNIKYSNLVQYSIIIYYATNINYVKLINNLATDVTWARGVIPRMSHGPAAFHTGALLEKADQNINGKNRSPIIKIKHLCNMFEHCNILKLAGPLNICIGIDATILRPIIQQIKVDIKQIKMDCFYKVFHAFHVSGNSSRICLGS